MNRLLIVDDEHHIVNWLSELFQSVEELDLEIMKAYSGFEMLNILKNYRMDIILLDIQMPGMDGLAAAQEALSEWPSTHIIFLTAYDNFHYLYQANQLPNTSYLLKTEDDETIVCTIRKVLEQIQLKTDTQNALEQATADKLLLDHLLQQDFLRTLIHGNYNQINILISGRQKRLVPIDFTQEVCLLLTCRSGASSLRPAAAMSNDSVIACLSFIKNLVYDKFSFCMLELDAESMLWFFQDNRPQERRLLVSTVNFLRNVSDDLAGSAEKHLHCHISNFLLTSPVSWRELASIVHQLQCYGLSNMHQNAYHISSSNTVPLHSLDARASSPEQMDTDTVLSKTADELSFYLYQKDRISYMELLAQASRKCGMVSSMHDLFVIQLYSSIALVLIRYISQYHLEKEISLKIAIHPLYYIQDFPNWQKAFQYLTSLSEHLFALMSDAESNRNEHLVSIVEKYINENLTRPLSLSDVASCINYNATYVARLYKQLRGISLTDYITKCRIQKAITLLVTTNDSIQSIARETGFDTSQYFSIVFKKAVKGVTGDFFRISLVGLWRAQGIIPKVFDEDGVNGADKDTGIRKPCGNRFIVSASMFHADLCFPVKTSDAFDQFIDCGLGVWNATGRHQDNAARPADGDGTLTFGNINTNSVHNRYSFTTELAMVNTRFTHCLFNLLGITRTPKGSTCVKRMLRMRAGWLTFLRTLSPERGRPDLLPYSF